MPGNPLVRFDEGRVGRTDGVALSPTLPTLEYQAKPGCSSELQGAHHVNCSFIRVVEPERVGVIRLVETGETNLRAAAQANPIRPRDAI